MYIGIWDVSHYEKGNRWNANKKGNGEKVRTFTKKRKRTTISKEIKLNSQTRRNEEITWAYRVWESI